MLFEQYYLNCLAHASYLIGDERTRTAVVVDPQRDVDRYLETAAARNLQIRHVFLTHFHADFVAGHLELRDRCGATIHLGARAAAEYAFHAMADGDVLDLGDVRLKVLETPGHTVESICILLYDLKADADHPRAILTGDTLFIGDVGRPDLRASLGWSAVDLGRMLYHSVHDKLLALPDATLVYPAHGAGSLCGKKLSSETVSTIGEQRRFNYALQPMDEDQFVRLVTADQPDAPPYFTYDAVLNTKEHPTLQHALERELTPLSLDQMLAQLAAGAQVLDVRDPSEFASAHLKGSINVGLGGQYATWAGTVLDRDRPVIIVAEPGREIEAAVRLGRIGFDIVSGFLLDGIHALETRPDLVASTTRLSAGETFAELASEPAPVLLDVRAPQEWETKHIQGAISIPLSRLRDRLTELAKAKRIIVHCAGGYRSSIAASLLQRNGFDDVAELGGGIAAWEAARLQTVDNR